MFARWCGRLLNVPDLFLLSVCTQVNEERELTQQFTRQYLDEQLLMTLAPRAAEELYFGPENMSSMNQRQLVMARRIVQKMIASGNMDTVDGIGHQTITVPFVHGRTKYQVE